MNELIESVFGNLNFFDIFFALVLLYSIIQCFLKGFSLSLISFMKWIVSTVVTIILVPKFQPIISEYIDSPFINNVGLGVAIFVLTLFITILIGKSLGRAVTGLALGQLIKLLVFYLVFLKDILFLFVCFQFLIGFILIKIGVYQLKRLYRLI
jgi:membrane protein required for colicin V production